jgi:mono/diheme cytochrome c family protein
MATYAGRVSIAESILVACAVTVGAAAQTPSGQKPVPTVKSAAAIPIVSVAGSDNFAAYCAVCHGADAKGNGPAAPAMKVPVPDLTTIAARNMGKFNPIVVEAIIKGTGTMPTPAHGVETMPIWGEVFRGSDAAATRLRIGNLVKYLESIQQPVK